MIHKYTMNGKNIVLDVNSGSVHVVDDLIFNMLDYYPDKPIGELPALLNNYTLDEIKEGYDELNTLKEEGLLFSPDLFDKLLQKPGEKVIKALCLHVAHDCNLKCSYCFAGEGEYNGDRGLMPLETGKTAVDFLIKSSGRRRNLEIDFFGGEPLMNFEAVKGIVDYAKSLEKKHDKRFRFTITTNGILLNEENQEYIIENMDNVVLSIDGRKEVNDKMRRTLSGHSAYDIIAPKFIRLSKKLGSYYVRGTFTRENLDFSKDVLHLNALGFEHISVEPVVAPETEEYALREEDLPQLAAEYEKLALDMIKLKNEGKGFNFFHFMIDLTGGPCVYKRLSGCGAGTEYLAVTPEGDLFPCHQFVGIDRFKMGNIKTGITNPGIREIFEANNIYSKKNCGDCFAKFYCSGGCIANAYNINKSFDTPYQIGCELQRKRTECAIMCNI